MYYQSKLLLPEAVKFFFSTIML